MRHVGVGVGEVVDHGESGGSQTAGEVIYRVSASPALA